MKDLKVMFKGVNNYNKKIHTVEVRVSDTKNTVRVWREELYPPISAFAKQLNRKKIENIHKALNQFRNEFELGEWDDERFRDLVV